MQTQTEPRLSAAEVEFYKREGYVIYRKALLSEPSFNGLKAHFEDKLERLDPSCRPEGMDCPHLVDTKLFEWLFSDEVLDLVEPLIGPDIALFASHFICKPKGNGKRVPWHEDSAYWQRKNDAGKLISIFDPMDVATVWLAIDPASRANGCMKVIPRTHLHGYSDYEPVDHATHVFGSEIKAHQRDESKAVYFELEPNQASVHHAKMMHGSDANTSDMRRCGYTMRYISTRCKSNLLPALHLYLARGKDHLDQCHGDPTRSYPELARFRERTVKNGH